MLTESRLMRPCARPRSALARASCPSPPSCAGRIMPDRHPSKRAAPSSGAASRANEAAERQSGRHWRAEYWSTRESHSSLVGPVVRCRRGARGKRLAPLRRHAEVREDAADHGRILDRGQHDHPSPAPGAREDIRLERAPHQLSPRAILRPDAAARRALGRGAGWGGRGGRRPLVFRDEPRHHRCAPGRVRREHPLNAIANFTWRSRASREQLCRRGGRDRSAP